MYIRMIFNSTTQQEAGTSPNLTLKPAAQNPALTMSDLQPLHKAEPGSQPGQRPAPLTSMVVSPATTKGFTQPT